MKKQFITTVCIILFTICLFPSIAFASWYNPFSWFNNWGIFNKPDNQTQVLENRIKELENKLDTNATTNNLQKKATTTINEVKKIETPKTDNSTQIRLQVEAALKAKEVQDALDVKQKADERAKIDAEKAELDRIANINAKKAQQAIDRANEEVINAQAQADSQKYAKQEKLDAINLKIANLNAKYASDSAKISSNGGLTKEQAYPFSQDLYSRYVNDYNALMAEYQQAQYSN